LDNPPQRGPPQCISALRLQFTRRLPFGCDSASDKEDIGQKRAPAARQPGTSDRSVTRYCPHGGQHVATSLCISGRRSWRTSAHLLDSA
jgi:hypothetical protein